MMMPQLTPENSRPFKDACMTFINSRLDNKSARLLATEYGYEPLLYNTLKILLKELPGSKLNAQVLGGSVTAEEAVHEFVARMRAFINLPAEELTPAHRYELKKLDLVATRNFISLYPSWSRQPTVSLLEQLLSSAAQQQALRLYQAPLQTPDGKPVKPSGAFSLLCLFEKPRLTADERWDAMREMLSVLGTAYHEPGIPSEMASVLSYDSTPFSVAPEGFIKVRYNFEMHIRSKALATFIKEHSYQYSTPFGLEVTATDDTVVFQNDPGGEWRHNKSKTSTSALQLSPSAFSLCAPGSAQAMTAQGLKPLQWHEPWAWPNVNTSSPQTRAQMMVWALMDHKKPDTAQLMADALGLPWEVMNDKGPDEWMLQDHTETEAYFLNIFSPSPLEVELPDSFTP